MSSYLKNLFARSGLIDRRYLARQVLAATLLSFAMASICGAYIQLGIFSYRTLLFPALLVWSLIGILLWDLVLFLRNRRRKEVLIHLAFAALLIFSVECVGWWRASWESKVVSRLTQISVWGSERHSEHWRYVRHVEFVPRTLEKEIENASCGEPMPERRSLGVRTYQLTCGSDSLLVDVIPLWNKADLHVRREKRQRT
jgi:hypothetical protein